MPIYEYRCKTCDNVFQKLLSIKECDSRINCKCGEQAIKLISHCSFVNEGSEHRDIDCIVGADAEKKWKNIYERKAIREKNKKKVNKE